MANHFRTSRVTSFHEDVFHEYFRPFRHRLAQFNIWGGFGLEIFGKDLELVRGYDQKYVWTVVDGEADQWIVPGLRYVNRVCYLLTQQAHRNVEIEFRVSRHAEPLTQLGLTRRVATLRRTLSGDDRV